MTVKVHKCPPRCHFCPDLNGEIMSGCMGTAAMALHGKDMSRCTCAQTMKDADSEITKLKQEVAQLKTTVQLLLKRIPSR